MNKSKRPMANKVQKKMAKSVRNAQTGVPSPEIRKYSDELTAKEMLKAYPKKAAAKKEALVESMKKGIAAKKTKAKKGVSKRTTPGTVPSDSTPANVLKEGLRWIKTLTKQTNAQRRVTAHHGRKK